jgi:hypothetical protein
MDPKSLPTQFAGVVLLVLAVSAGCNQVPMAPSRSVALNVTLSRLDSVRASLLGTTQNEILYRLDGAGDLPGHGVYGPFSAPVSAGAASFSLKVPSRSGPQVLSLQLNDASTHQPLAVGATQFDFGTGLAGGLVVDMGSVTRNCYYTDESRSPGVNNLYNKSSTYNFAADALVGTISLGTGSDIAFSTTGVPVQFFFEEAANGPGPVAKSIAYLGKGDLVDFDMIPDPSLFFPFSYQSKAAAGAPVTTLEAGDIYCVNLVSIPPVNGVFSHAWVQITDPGVPNTYGPNFRFRVNSTLPYYGYEQTPADLGNTCSQNY